ncbi:MAG: hypothetical protein AAF515_13260 [Pseudomonadota bacterium]
MPSSNETPDGFVEVVRSRDNPLESRYVFGTIVGIVIVAALLLLVSQRDRPRAHELPTELANLATQLSNARVEIALLQDIGALAPQPDLADLRAAELPPFEQSNVRQPQAGCVLFDADPYEVRFRRGTADVTAGGAAGGAAERAEKKESWTIAWRAEHDGDELDHAAHQAEASACADGAEWQAHIEEPR